MRACVCCRVYVCQHRERVAAATAATAAADANSGKRFLAYTRSWAIFFTLHHEIATTKTHTLLSWKHPPLASVKVSTHQRRRLLLMLLFLWNFFFFIFTPPALHFKFSIHTSPCSTVHLRCSSRHCCLLLCQLCLSFFDWTSSIYVLFSCFLLCFTITGHSDCELEGFEFTQSSRSSSCSLQLDPLAFLHFLSPTLLPFAISSSSSKWKGLFSLSVFYFAVCV